MTSTLTGLHAEPWNEAGLQSQSSAFTPFPRPIRVTVRRERQAPRWLPYVLGRLNDMADAFSRRAAEGAVMVHPDALARALEVAAELIGDDAPAPSVVPTVGGGVQFVWHRGGWDIEIEVLRGRTEVWGRNRETGERFEGDPDETGAALAAALAQMARSQTTRG